jgi:hypothetical protein
MNENIGEVAAIQEAAQQDVRETEAQATDRPPALDHMPPGMMMRYMAWRD